MRKVQILVELGCDPDLSSLNASMLKVDGAEIAGAIYLIEMKGDGLHQMFLIAFGCEMIVGFAIVYEIASYLALRQQRIASDSLAFDFEGIQQRNCCLDFVGLFFFGTAFYWQCADFFWV